MRRLFSVACAVLCAVSLFGQAPQKMSYQAVIRDVNDQLVTNQQIGLKLNIFRHPPGTVNKVLVYSEVQTPMTNDNGLISIKYGGGIGFDTISWGNGQEYSIGTLVDPTGGTNYTIKGSSQLLSVPYALYAENCGSGGSINPAHYVGELYDGGVVFYVDHTGEHGLILGMIDVTDSSYASVWSDIIDVEIGTPAQSLWNGQANTLAIIGQSVSVSAADLCNDYVNADYGTGVFSDWYLPSITELHQLFINYMPVQKTLESDGNSATETIFLSWVDYAYWSSTEESNYKAFCLYFSGGSNVGASLPQDKDLHHHVRAVRAF